MVYALQEGIGQSQISFDTYVFSQNPKRLSYGINLNLSPKIGIWQMNFTASLFFVDEDLEAIGITHKWNGLCTDFTLDNTFTLPHSWMLNVKGLAPTEPGV